MRSIDINSGRHESDQICQEHSVPALDHIIGKGEVRLTEDEVSANKVVSVAFLEKDILTW